MFQGLHTEGQDNGLDILLRGDSQPDEFRFRLGNSLLMRLGSTSGSFEVGDVIQGDSSTDDGVVEKVKTIQGDTVLKLSGIGEAEVFEVGEGITNQTRSGAGTIINGVMNLSNVSVSYLQRNETIEGSSSGATAKIEGVYGQMVSVTDITGTFTADETIVGQTTGAEATMDSIYAGVPGLFKDDTTSDIIGEPTSGGYDPVVTSVSETTWPTKQTDISGNYYMLSKTVTFTASGSAMGPVNTIIITAKWEGGDEIMLASAPLKDTPPSELISEDTTLNVQHRMSLD